VLKYDDIKFFFEEKLGKKVFFFQAKLCHFSEKKILGKKLKEFLFSSLNFFKLSQHLYMTTYLFCSQGILFGGWGGGEGRGPGVKL
jgi:hypothetical protein